MNLRDSKMVKAMGFDEVRVRYRQIRREVVREVILKRLNGTKLHQYIEAMANRMIPESHRPAFTEDVVEDLELMDESRLIGFGVTPEQLKTWQQLNN